MPTFAHGKGAKFFIVDSGSTERDISNVLTQVQLPKTADTADVSALGTTAKQYVAGLLDSTLSLEGNRDTTVEGYLDGVVGTTTTYSYFPEGSASSKIKYSGTIVCNGLTDTSSIGDANKFTFSGQGTGPVTRTVL